MSFLLVANPSSGSDGVNAVAQHVAGTEGVLDGRIVPVPAGLRGRVRFVWEVARAHPFNGRVVRTTAKQVDVRLRGGPRAVAFDGEGDAQFGDGRATIQPGALRVVVPAAAEGGTSRS